MSTPITTTPPPQPTDDDIRRGRDTLRQIEEFEDLGHPIPRRRPDSDRER